MVIHYLQNSHLISGQWLIVQGRNKRKLIFNLSSNEKLKKFGKSAIYWHERVAFQQSSFGRRR